MLTLSANAHEFWLEVQDYTIVPEGQLSAALMVGEDFGGSSYAYIPANFRRFDLAIGDEEPRPAAGRIGDRPALQTEIDTTGLLKIIHVTRDYQLTWDSWGEFAGFVAHKAGEGVLETHSEQGYPQEDVREVYSRYGKSLVAVGEGRGEDRAFGLPTEIVARENPYTGDLSDGLDVQLYYGAAPRADAQVEVFSKTGPDDVRIETVRTDADGRATVPVEAGRTYLLNAVVFRQPADTLDPEFDPMWETLWASLTFAVPAAD
ncbi:protein of unknown function [Palleronia marisminoris]|uniref:Nickel uptake substrate-specific transmembrane region n=2 Tax=Palleronia marisminoris TaxID=315423 RepID=A0A1Y5RSX4_9RHOB|nr:protein of unknown function [Palleronia marisminoris]SLN24626.1 Nickel uptake substrate-specific transmembrane region [Palleronia marisminoris]